MKMHEGLKKGEPVMADMKVASWTKSKVEVVENYLTNEFESFVVAHRANDSCAHFLTIDNAKKGFALRIGWPIFADRRFTPASWRGCRLLPHLSTFRLRVSMGFRK